MRFADNHTCNSSDCQCWYWTDEWQAAEREAEAEIAAGRTVQFDTIEEMLDWLDDDG